jgi:hypothetical protein
LCARPLFATGFALTYFLMMLVCLMFFRPDIPLCV